MGRGNLCKYKRGYEYLETVVSSYSIMLTFLCHEKCFHRPPDRNAREINTLSGMWARFVSYRLKYFRYLCAKYFM